MIQDGCERLKLRNTQYLMTVRYMWPDQSPPQRLVNLRVMTAVTPSLHSRLVPSGRTAGTVYRNTQRVSQRRSSLLYLRHPHLVNASDTFRSRFQFPRSEFAPIRALQVLKQVFNFRRLRDYLAHQGRTSPSAFERVCCKTIWVVRMRASACVRTFQIEYDTVDGRRGREREGRGIQKRIKQGAMRAS